MSKEHYFEISFARNKINTDLNLVNEYADTYNSYENQDKIDEVLSHLIYLDQSKKEQCKVDGNIQTPNIDFSITYKVDGKKIKEDLSVPLGLGHFGKGINHLRETFKKDLTLNTKEKSQQSLNEILDQKCNALSIPPKIDIDSLQEKGFDTLGKCAMIAQAVSNDELAAFLKGFQSGIRNENKNNQKKNQKTSDANLVNEIKEKASQAIKNQKKSKNINQNKKIDQEKSKEL